MLPLLPPPTIFQMAEKKRRVLRKKEPRKKLVRKKRVLKSKQAAKPAVRKKPSKKPVSRKKATKKAPTKKKTTTRKRPGKKGQRRRGPPVTTGRAVVTERDLDEDRHPYERQTFDGDKPWAAFQLYRDMLPKDRSVVAAYASTRGGRGAIERGVAPRHWRDWAKRNRWRDRAAAWDRHLDNLARLQEEHDAMEARKGRRAALSTVVVRATEALSRPEVDKKGKPVLGTDGKPKVRNPFDSAPAKDIAGAILGGARELRTEFGDENAQRIVLDPSGDSRSDFQRKLDDMSLDERIALYKETVRKDRGKKPRKKKESK